MDESARPQYLLVKASIAVGLLLGVLLLGQTVLTYRFVRTGMVRQEARREADRRVQSMIASSRLAGSRDAATLLPVIDDLVKGAPQQFAWARVLKMDGTVIVSSGKPANAPSYAPGQLSKLMLDRDSRPEIRQTPSGPVLIALNTIRIGRAPGPVPGVPIAVGVMEIAVYTDTVSTRFGSLRENLILGCSAAFALMAAAFLIGIRFRHYLRGKQVEEQMAMARRVQFDLLPPGSLLTRDLEFAAKCVPTWQVGGDFYDAFETEDHQIGLVLGDVSGKGLSAALLIGVVQGVIHASNGTGSAFSHEQSMERLNHLLCMKTARERFVSLVWCYFDPVRSVLRYINAGHLPPFLVRQNASGAIETHRLDEGGGPVLGLLPGASYTQVEIAALPGDLLVVFSDGIVEAENSLDQEFGEERILSAIKENWSGSPTQIRDAILGKVRQFLGKGTPQDDQTLMVVRLQQVPLASRREDGVKATEIVAR
jgi:serine phosphatase RsbU (regulator of sigma subunit)